MSSTVGQEHIWVTRTGEGGYVYAEPGMYENVALLDIASMHPTTIESSTSSETEYTKNFARA
jgi:DNA polymerase elongation subunit (family B)